jgi:sulfonate dioxygenase
MSTTTTIEKVSEPLVSYDINLPYTELSSKDNSTKYPEYLPTWDPVWYDPLPLFPFEDPALRVKDKSKPNLLTNGVTIQDIQPRMGSVVTGLQLSKLSDAAKDELALLVSERKVLAFPEQDLIDAGPAAQHEFMKYFGKLNYQPVSGTIKGYPGFHIIHRDGNKEEIAKFFEHKATSTLWHQDVSYEAQPPGYVMLGLLQGPEVGGDTVFAATDEAYRYVCTS